MRHHQHPIAYAIGYHFGGILALSLLALPVVLVLRPLLRLLFR